MDETAMTMGVKFMTKPGKQWGTRRKVLNGMRDLFEKNDIRFAHHEVTVRVAGRNGSQSAPASPEATQDAHDAAGAAAQKIAKRTRLDDKETLSDDLQRLSPL